MKRYPAWIAAGCALAMSAGELRASGDLLFDSTISRLVSLQVLTREPETSRIVTFSMDDIEPKAEWASRAVSLVVGDAAPPPLPDFEALLSSNGDRIDLDWSASGALAVGDIEYYEIYFDESGFNTISGRTPDAVVPLSTQTYSLTGLTPYKDRYLTIVAVDALGNRHLAVTPKGLYVLSPEVLSRAVTVFADSLEGNADRVSRAASLVVSDVVSPPAVLGIAVSPSPRGTAVALDWSDYGRLAVGDIQSFEIYAEKTLFDDISGLSPKQVLNAETTATSLSFAELDQDRYFAVVAVDAFGRREVLVTPAGAYVLFAEVLSRAVTWQAADLKTNADHSSRAADLLVYDAAPPAAINGELADVTSTQSFRGVSLDWSAYNALEQLDIDHYDIYYSTTEFTDIGDALKISMPARIGMGLASSEIILPASLGLFFVAVVPVDGGGNFETNVIPNLVQSSVGGVNAPTGLQVASDGSGVLFFWDTPPEGEQPFLASYRIFLPGGQAVELPPTTTSWHSSALPDGLIYPFQLAAINIFDDPSDLVRAPEPVPVPKVARKCHIISTPIDPNCTYTDASGQEAGVMLDAQGNAYLVFWESPEMPITQTCPEQGSLVLSGLETRRAYVLEFQATSGKSYFSATGEDLKSWEQVSPLVSGGDAPVALLMPFDERDRAFFVIFSY
ncbi:MAG: hypothetical protein K9N23_19485 [Akkermansiaceae bacterium]|nr:hypothetical protein [Akkermansiaceae bacterium]